MNTVRLFTICMFLIAITGCQNGRIQQLNATLGLNTLTIEEHEIKVPVGYAEMSRNQTQKMLKGSKKGFAYLKGSGDTARLDFPMIFYSLYKGNDAKGWIITTFNGQDVLEQYLIKNTTPAQQMNIIDYYVSDDRQFSKISCSYIEPISGIKIREIYYSIQHNSEVVLLTNRTAGDTNSLQSTFYAFANAVKNALEQ